MTSNFIITQLAVYLNRGEKKNYTHEKNTPAHFSNLERILQKSNQHQQRT